MRGSKRWAQALGPARKLRVLPLAAVLATSASCVIGIFDEDSGSVSDNRFEAAATFSFDVPVQNRSRLRVEAVSGFIEVRSVPGLSTVTISGRRVVGAESTNAAQARLDDLRVDVDEFQSEVVVRTDQPRNTNGRRYEVEYAIVVPDNFRVDLDQTNGSIDVWGPLSDTDITNVNGAVNVRGLSQSSDVVVVNGNVDADMAGVEGALRFATTNGNLSLRIPTTSSARLTAQVVNGSIGISGLTLSGQTVTQRSLSGTLGSGDFTIDLTTVNGNISVSAN